MGEEEDLERVKKLENRKKRTRKGKETIALRRYRR
jgi:hypothetical protein